VDARVRQWSVWVVIVGFVTLTDGRVRAEPATWPAAGRDLHNTRNQPDETRIGPDNVANLGVRWVFQVGNDIFATPAVDEASVYVPDAVGNVFAIDRESGAQRWQTTLASLTGIDGDYSRTTPTLDGSRLFLGDQGGRASQGARVLALDKASGALLWVTQIEAHPASLITQSPVVYGDSVFIGTSSNEEGLAEYVSGYACCSFRGSVVALDKATGAIRWKTYMTPTDPELGFSGTAVWGSTPVVDVKRRSLYVTTGNNYAVPPAILDCQALPTTQEIVDCVAAVPGSADNHLDAVVALDLETGKIKWSHSLSAFDAWTVSCVASDLPENDINCSTPHGEDFDFGQGPILYRTRRYGHDRELLGAGQKSGVYWALDPDDGSVVWQTQVGPGNALGGLLFGSAMDGQRIYTAVANGPNVSWQLSAASATTYGFWSALDPATGSVLWQTAGDPNVTTLIQGPLTVANGVVYGGVLDAAGTMYALDARSGDTLWTFASGGSVNAGAAVVDGAVYWGSGYFNDQQTESDKLYAFEIKDSCTL
jgi:polyvinyl alcohol dehydrogenase (cytochrome)